jgi:Flp pilus assembly protein TadD
MRTEAKRTQLAEADDTSAFLHRAWRLRRRGEMRKFMLTLRKACQLHETSARLWTQYAVACASTGHAADAREALARALWLRQRCHDAGRANTTRLLLVQLERGTLGGGKRAA